MLWRGPHFDWADYMIFAACFMLRGRDMHIDFLRLLFLVGMVCPLIQAHFLWPLLKLKSSSLRLNKGFRLFNFLQAIFFCPWMWCDGFLQRVCHAGPSSLVFLQDVKCSRIVIHRPKFRRIDCSLNWSYFKHGELRCESVKIALRQWFLNSSLFF